MRDLDRKLESAVPSCFVPSFRHDVDGAERRRLAATVADHRAAVGLQRRPAPLLTAPDGNIKLALSERPTYGLSLAPAKSSGRWNTCRYSTPTCEAHCVGKSGNNRFDSAQKGKLWKTNLLGDDPGVFLTLLAWEIDKAVAKWGAINVRLNTFSDIRWERFAWLFDRWGDAVQFYDYTKWPAGRRDLPSNYHLVYSATERDDDEAVRLKAAVGPVAVVFDTKRGAPLPSEYLGLPVLDGDATDDRYDDHVGVVVGLRVKGTLKGDDTGFVRKGN